MIVEDDADTRALLQYALEAEQAKVLLATSADDAIALLKSWVPNLIISDISMPEMDGYDFIRHVRTTQPHPIPAIALTANAREEDRTRALTAGFDAHLTKPIPLDCLRTEINRLFNYL